jgi:hypothetical protein
MGACFAGSIIFCCIIRLFRFIPCFFLTSLSRQMTHLQFVTMDHQRFCFCVLPDDQVVRIDGAYNVVRTDVPVLSFGRLPIHSTRIEISNLVTWLKAISCLNLTVVLVLPDPCCVLKIVSDDVKCVQQVILKVITYVSKSSPSVGLTGFGSTRSTGRRTSRPDIRRFGEYLVDSCTDARYAINTTGKLPSQSR